MSMKRKVLMLTVLLLSCGIFACILPLNATINNIISNSGDLSTSSTTLAYDWITVWQGSQSQTETNDDVVISSTGSIIVGGRAQISNQYLAIFDRYTGARSWNDTITFSTPDYEFTGLDVNGTDIYAVASNNGNEGFLYKYNSTQSQEWNSTWRNGTRSTRPADIALDASNVYVVGQGGDTGFLAKFNTAGTKLWNVSVADTFRCLGVATNGSSVYVAGRADVGNGDAFLSKHSKTDGAQDWFVTFGNGTSTDAALDLAIDNSGNIYVTGAFQNDGYQAFLAKLNSTGHIQWLANYTTNNSQGLKVAINPANNNIYVVGWIGDDYYAHPSKEALLLTFDTSGNLKSNATYKHEAEHWTSFSSIAIDASGYIILVGRGNTTANVYKAFVMGINVGSQGGLPLNLAEILIGVLIIIIPACAIVGLAVIVGRKQT